MVMKPILFGALVGLVWLVAGVPLTPVADMLSVLVQPVTLAFVLGAAARPYVTRWRTA